MMDGMDTPRTKDVVTILKTDNISYLCDMKKGDYKQTGIRLPEILIAKAKRKAKRRGLSFNAYVESVLQKDVNEEIPYIDPEAPIDPELLSLAKGVCLPPREVIEQDNRLREILLES